MILWLLIASIFAWLWVDVGRRWACVYLTGVCLIAACGSAFAGVDNPTKFDGVHVVHRCPKLSNPIECTSLSHSSRREADRAIPHTGHHIPGVKACTLDRDIYEYHHGLSGKPRSLRGYHGCKLYAIDAAYHRSLEKFNMPDNLQEATERVLSAMGVTPSDLGHIALTTTPQ